MVPSSVAEARLILGPQQIVRFNNYSSATINGGPAPGRQFGRGDRGDGGSISATTLPPGCSYEWTGTQHCRRSRQQARRPLFSRLAVLFAYLFLVGLWLRAGPIPIRGAAVGHGRHRRCDAGAEVIAGLDQQSLRPDRSCAC